MVHCFELVHFTHTHTQNATKSQLRVQCNCRVTIFSRVWFWIFCIHCCIWRILIYGITITIALYAVSFSFLFFFQSTFLGIDTVPLIPPLPLCLSTRTDGNFQRTTIKQVRIQSLILSCHSTVDAHIAVINWFK